MISRRKSVRRRGGFKHPLFVDDLSDRTKLDRALKHFTTFVKEYERGESIEVHASTFLFADLIRAFSRDIQKLICVDRVAKPSEFRVAGLLAFWIRKLKPLHYIERSTGEKTADEIEQLNLYLNEQFAINVGLTQLSGYDPSVAAANLQLIVNSDSYSDILSHLRYRAISPQAMSLYYKFLVDVRISQEESITKLVTALEYRDDVTGEHVKRIGKICKILGNTLNLPSYQVRNLSLAAMMHDIGKIGVEDAILKSKRRLSRGMRAQINEHPVVGEQILRNSISPIMISAKIIARSHHERWDGTGYPDGLAGREIPLEARIVAIADSFDAMMSDRPYQPSRGKEWSLNEIRNQKGKQFDPDVCDVFLSQQEAILSLY
jgi:HD-GYP domain-containing protein (c-di-GMP phosphodiesterase class II)